LLGWTLAPQIAPAPARAAEQRLNVLFIVHDLRPELGCGRDWQTGKVLAAELYDHLRDPAETRNQVAAPADAANLATAKASLHQAVPPGVPPSKR
jgi:hypothetical protein